MTPGTEAVKDTLQESMHNPAAQTKQRKNKRPITPSGAPTGSTTGTFVTESGSPMKVSKNTPTNSRRSSFTSSSITAYYSGNSLNQDDYPHTDMEMEITIEDYTQKKEAGITSNDEDQAAKQDQADNQDIVMSEQ